MARPVQEVVKLERERAAAAGVPFKTFRKMNTPSALYCHVADTVKRRCKKNKMECEITGPMVRQMWETQNGVCALTGVVMKYVPAGAGNFTMNNPFGLSVDRINPLKGYVSGNMRLVCFWANNAKYTFGDDVFYRMCRIATDLNSK